MKIVSPLLVALLLTCSAQARTLVVNPALPGADDANPGSDTQPFRTIGRAASLVQQGDLVQIHSGVYRETVLINQSGTERQPIRFEAAPGATVAITAADELTGWRQDTNGTYSIPWPHKLFQGDDHNPGGVEQAFIAGSLLRKVADLKELTEGAFFVDLQRQRLHLGTSRNPDETRVERPIEGSTRSEVWIVKGAYVHTRGLRFRRAANRAQNAMVQFRGAHAVVEDCIFEWSNSNGASFTAEDIKVRRCVFADNGQEGFTAVRAHRLHFDSCTVQRNNVKNFPRGWEAGGNKLCLCRDVILENSRFIKNRGNGIWFDIGNENCTVRNCLIADNEDAGIFYEISYGLHAYDNVVVRNGLARTKGAWAANGGICLSSSPGCVIERNLIVGNEQGFCFREQDRTTPRIDGTRGAEVPVWNHDEVIRDNLIINNRTAQVQGWFDIATERHWPKTMQTGKVEAAKAKEDLAADYQAGRDGVPVGLSLESLNIAFLGNIYAVEANQPFFIWGADWKRKQIFKDLQSVTETLRFEDLRSRLLPLFPINAVKGDFRLPSEILALVKHAYPRGQVPDCVLGIAGTTPP